MIKKLLYAIHRVLGTFLSILFLVWFLSGFVMIYHKFPKVSSRDKYSVMEALVKTDIRTDSLFSFIPTEEKVLKLSLKSFSSKPYWQVSTDKSNYTILADEKYKFIEGNWDYPALLNYAQRWNDSPISKVDTLYKLEQWIPFGYLRKDFPIYKFYFGDKEKHQLYVSSLTGEALQYTSNESRFWSWLGAVPHWIYFTSLRQNSVLWKEVIIWLSGIGCIMCIAGIVLGIRAYRENYKRRKRFKTPYKKRVYRWHHIMGFCFGIFVFTFTFSGMMSLAKMPEWIVKVHDKEIQKKIYQQPEINLDDFKTDINQFITSYPEQVKNIEWGYFGSLPIYKVVINKRLKVFNASNSDITPLNITEEDIKNYLDKIHNESFQISTMENYDNYYVGLTDHLPLPVYKVEVNNPDKSTYYINPHNGNLRYFNSNTKARRWTYQGLHSYKFKFLAERPVLWNIVMWVTMIGGTIVSFTGVWLGLRFLKRKFLK